MLFEINLFDKLLNMEIYYLFMWIACLYVWYYFTFFLCFIFYNSYIKSNKKKIWYCYLLFSIIFYDVIFTY